MARNNNCNNRANEFSFGRGLSSGTPQHSFWRDTLCLAEKSWWSAANCHWILLVQTCIKSVNTFALTRVTEYMSPRQVGVGVSGGCDAAVHSSRRFLQSMQQDSILIKQDF